MGLQKGKTNNPNGKPKGTKSSKTKQWEALGDKIEGELTEKVIEEILKLKGATLVDCYAKVLSYFKPKLAQVQQNVDVDAKGSFTIILNNDKPNKETE